MLLRQQACLPKFTPLKERREGRSRCSFPPVAPGVNLTRLLARRSMRSKEQVLLAPLVTDALLLDTERSVTETDGSKEHLLLAPSRTEASASISL